VRIREVIRSEDGSSEERLGIRDTTIGRAMVWEIVPEGCPSTGRSSPGQEGDLRLINHCYRDSGAQGHRRVRRPDHVPGLPHGHPRRCLHRPGRHGGAGEKAASSPRRGRGAEIEDQYTQGLVTNGERYNKVVDIWSRTNDQVAKSMMRKLGKNTVLDRDGKRPSRTRSTPST
jgi:DNA-directed RNA polymerase subunit beta'